LAISIIAIFSCRKSFESQPIPDQKIEASDETETKILEFINSMTDPLKSGSTHTISEAIWYSEATLNFTYAIYDSSFVYLSRESSTFSITLNANNTVNHTDLLATYAKMVDSLEAHYDGIPCVTKHVFLCNIINVSSSVGVLDLKMISVIGCNYTINQYGSFDTTDYWYSGDTAGKCGDYYPSYLGQDATTQLEYKLLHPLIATNPNVRVYFEDIDTVFMVDPVDYYYPNSPRLSRGYVYGSNNPNDWIQCLPPYELNFYISSNGIPYMIEDNDTFIDKEFCDIDIKWYFAASNEYYVEQHYYDIAYGVRHETTVAASEL
jgi:hypothetical protein